ncbi:unnamed protein product, partial [Scytosiphon promiscuus]
RYQCCGVLGGVAGRADGSCGGGIGGRPGRGRVHSEELRRRRQQRGVYRLGRGGDDPAALGGRGLLRRCRLYAAWRTRPTHRQGGDDGRLSGVPARGLHQERPLHRLGAAADLRPGPHQRQL